MSLKHVSLGLENSFPTCKIGSLKNPLQVLLFLISIVYHVTYRFFLSQSYVINDFLAYYEFIVSVGLHTIIVF